MMPFNEIRAVVNKRLARWRRLLIDDGGTPILLIGVGQLEGNEGQLILLATEDMPNEEIALFCYTAGKTMLEQNPPEGVAGRWEYDVKLGSDDQGGVK